jgi:small conductance mechanosensitive channel
MSGHEMVTLVTDKLYGWLEALISHLPDFGLAVVVLVLFWLIAKGVRAGVFRALSRTSENQAVNRLIATVCFLGLIGAGVFFALGILDLDKTVTSLLAGAGILGLALAFAFQDAAENLVSGVTISISQPFRVGDFIETNGFLGTVEDISLRSTAVRRSQGQLVLIPNSTVFKNPLINYTETSDRRVDLEVGVSYADDLEKAKQVAIAALDGLEGRNPEREVELFYTGFGGSSIDFVIRFWLTDAYQGSYMAARSAAIQRIKTAFDREGVSIPFPIRTLDFGIEGGKTLKEMLDKGVD